MLKKDNKTMATLESIRKGCIIFKTPDNIHNNYGIQIYNEKDNSMVDLFDEACYAWFRKIKEICDIDIRWFHQGRTNDWSYFEFWNGVPYQDMILDFAESLSKVFDISLEIE